MEENKITDIKIKQKKIGGGKRFRGTDDEKLKFTSASAANRSFGNIHKYFETTWSKVGSRPVRDEKKNSRPTERRPTGTPHARAKIEPWR